MHILFEAKYIEEDLGTDLRIEKASDLERFLGKYVAITFFQRRYSVIGFGTDKRAIYGSKREDMCLFCGYLTEVNVKFAKLSWYPEKPISRRFKLEDVFAIELRDREDGQNEWDYDAPPQSDNEDEEESDSPDTSILQQEAGARSLAPAYKEKKKQSIRKSKTQRKAHRKKRRKSN